MTTCTITTPVDLGAAVPAVLGFTPETSLMVLRFAGTRRCSRWSPTPREVSTG